MNDKFKIKVTTNGIQFIPPDDFKKFVFEKHFLYVIKDKEAFIYVGITKRTINKRFYDSFYANEKKKKGQYAYKWIDEYKGTKKKLAVYLIPINREKDVAEAIEGELVYKIRTETRKWPIYQNEIHFRNIKGTKSIAEKIFNEL